MTETRLRCDCNHLGHGLIIAAGDWRRGGLVVRVQMTVFDSGLWQRIKAAWAVLCGDDHALAEVHVHRDDVPDLVDFVCGLMHDEATEAPSTFAKIRALADRGATPA